jgi:hypothetical protein
MQQAQAAAKKACPELLAGLSRTREMEPGTGGRDDVLLWYVGRSIGGRCWGRFGARAATESSTSKPSNQGNTGVVVSTCLDCSLKYDKTDANAGGMHRLAGNLQSPSPIRGANSAPTSTREGGWVDGKGNL